MPFLKFPVMAITFGKTLKQMFSKFIFGKKILWMRAFPGPSGKDELLLVPEKSTTYCSPKHLSKIEMI